MHSPTVRNWADKSGPTIRSLYYSLRSKYTDNQQFWRKFYSVCTLTDSIVASLRVADSGKPKLSDLCVRYELDVLGGYWNLLGVDVAISDFSPRSGQTEESFWVRYWEHAKIVDDDSVLAEWRALRFDGNRSIYDAVRDVILPAAIARRKDCVVPCTTIAALLDPLLQYNCDVTDMTVKFEPKAGLQTFQDMCESMVGNTDVTLRLMKALTQYRKRTGPFAAAGMAACGVEDADTFWNMVPDDTDAALLRDLVALPLLSATGSQSDVERSFRDMNVIKSRRKNMMKDPSLEARLQCKYAWQGERNLEKRAEERANDSAMGRARAEFLRCIRIKCSTDRLVARTRTVLADAATRNTEFGNGLRQEVLDEILQAMGHLEKVSSDEAASRDEADMEISDSESEVEGGEDVVNLCD
eukprot:3934615-Rhodomonas_salina.1